MKAVLSFSTDAAAPGNVKRKPAAMNAGLDLVTVRKSDLEDPGFYPRWEDPYRIARMSEAKRRAFLANPLSTSGDDPVQLLALQGKRVVGRQDTLAGEVVVHGESVPVLWGSALYVPPECRQMGTGLALMLRMLSLHHTVGACGISDLAFALVEKLGWVHFEMPRRVLLVRSRPVLEKYLRARFPTALIANAADLLLFLHNAFRRRPWAPGAAGLVCRETERMSEELEGRLADRSRPLACHRSSRWMNWLLASSFLDRGPDFRRLFFLYHAGDEPLAYFLIKVQLHTADSSQDYPELVLGSLIDWHIFDSSRVQPEQLMAHGIRQLVKCGVDAIELCAMEKREQAFARSVALRQAGVLRFALRASGASPLRGTAYRERSSWRLRPAEADHAF